ncbi:hypothetical protein IP90_01684 [Luteimonas cucumeris]|uniref:Serine aminopeptidase S33 domain-containing protein n=1 Tax=Luteimonas cucumeris TaxID=985012 RepID=A0A562L8L0_9GAMM|nr:alpha/beta fold hydrolase [Luteimonas cucumeris]TWI03866.1 hypothetical protein IP90_01684 [Luteimonas cucumeris]
MIPRLVWMPLATLAILYGGLAGWMYFKQRDLVYYPQFTRLDAARTDFAIERDGMPLRGWLLHPGKPHAILYFGGNAERIEDNREDFSRWFPDHSVYLLAYRGYGANDGQPNETDLRADALALFDAVQARHPEQPVSVIGRSLGSGVASYVAAQRPVGRLALITPFDSMAAVAQSHFPWLPVKWLLKDRYPSAEHLAGRREPTLVIRAEHDEVVPAANTERLLAALPVPPQVVTIADADHNNLGADPAFGEALSAFMR